MTIAKAKASIGNITIGTKTVKLVLEIGIKDFFKNTRFFESAPDEVQMILGDPQMSIDDYTDDDEVLRRRLWHTNRLTATVDSSGVVEKVEGEKDQLEMVITSPSQEASGDKESGVVGGAEAKEEHGEEGNAALSEAEQANKEESTDKQHTPASREELENYILTEKPMFEGVEIDFPSLLQRRKDGASWMEIPQSLNIPSSTLQSKYTAYKKLVAEKMASNKQGAA